MLTLEQQQQLRKDAILRTPMHDHRDTIQTTTFTTPFSTEAQEDGSPRLAKVTNNHCPLCMTNDIDITPLESSRNATTAKFKP